MSPTHKNNGLNRRQFLSHSGCAALGLTTVFSSLISMKAIAAAALDKSNGRSPENYKALVCVLLDGGADSFNMLVPRNGNAYNQYFASRSNLALPQNAILPIDHTDAQGTAFGVHPAMPEIRQLFNAGHLSFLANVGTLVEPVNKAQYLANDKKLPLGLFSHSDQIKHWQTGRPGEVHRYGWAGRIADLMAAQNGNPSMSMNISLNGVNQLQQGQTTTEFALSADEKFGITGMNRTGLYHAQRNSALNSMIDAQYADVFEQSYINTVKSAVQKGGQLQTALEASPSFDAVFSGSAISQQLRAVARIIAARDRLDAGQQTFFIRLRGWDHHDEVLEAQQAMLTQLSRAMGEFYTALQQMEVNDKVTTFSISDFGRTLTSNGNGSDHAWGGNAMIMGGGVIGGQVFGNYPLLELGSNAMLDRGVLLPTTSATEYMAELALWFGVSPSDVVDIFPDLPNFYNPFSGNLPIGFMNA